MLAAFLVITIKKARIFRFRLLSICTKLYYLTNCFVEGLNFVKTIPSTAASYSSIVGVLPKIVDKTTTGVDDNKDSPFFSPRESRMPQPSLSAAARPGRPARASESSADCVTSG